jgi:xylan 1,4-beta-xylosidase
VDFVTTHTYGVDGGFLDEQGHADTKLSPSPDAIVGDVRHVRQQIEASSHPGLPLYFTEWSTSYTPRDLVHDSYHSAAYILSKLQASGGLVQGMSYWTFSDLFEEPGPPTAAFQGGFGLLNPQGIRKPAWFAYKYLHRLGERVVDAHDAQSVATLDGPAVHLLAWDFTQPVQAVSNRPYFGAVRPAPRAAPLRVEFAALEPGRYVARLYRTGYGHNDAYTAWLKMGSPAVPSRQQLARLQGLTTDRPASQDFTVDSGGTWHMDIPMHANDVVLLEVQRHP